MNFSFSFDISFVVFLCLVVIYFIFLEDDENYSQTFIRYTSNHEEEKEELNIINDHRISLLDMLTNYYNNDMKHINTNNTINEIENNNDEEFYEKNEMVNLTKSSLTQSYLQIHDNMIYLTIINEIDIENNASGGTIVQYKKALDEFILHENDSYNQIAKIDNYQWQYITTYPLKHRIIKKHYDQGWNIFITFN